MDKKCESAENTRKIRREKRRISLENMQREGDSL